MRKLYCLFRFWWIPGMLMLFSLPGKAQTISRYSIDDAIVNQAYPDSVIDQSKLGGNLKIYRFRDAGGLKEVYSYVKFDISALNGFMVESAVLSYRGKTGDANFNDLFKMGVYAVNSDWKGDTLKYKTKPSLGGSRLDTTFLNANSARKDFLKNGTGLIDYINEEIRKGKSSISFAIKSFGKDTTDNMWIGGTTNGNYGPILNCVITPLKGKYVIDDAVVMEAYPDSVIDQSKLGGNLKVFRKRDGGATYYRTNSYIKFDISDLAGTQLESATISYRGKTGDANYNDVFKLALYSVSQEWKGDTVRWKFKPSAGSTKLDTSFLNANSARKTFLKNGTGLVDFINEEIRKGSKTISFAMQSFGKDSTDNMWIGGLANGNYGPVLDFTVTANKSKYTIDDAIVMQAYPDSIIDQSKLGGNIKVFRERNAGGTIDETYSYLKFDVSELQGVQVESASLSYRGKTGDANFNDLFKLGLYTVTQDWKGDTVKYKTRPSVGGSRMDTSFLNASSARREFLKNGTTLVTYINEEIRKGSKSISFALKSFGKDTTDNMWIGGTANGNYGPILNLTLSSANSNYCVDDAVVMQAYPDSIIDQGKLGGNLKIYKKRNASGIMEQTYSYVKFDISGLNNQQIESAKVSFRGKTGDANFNDLFKLGLYSVTQDWKGDTVKWKTKPSTNATRMDTSLLNSNSARKDFLTNGTKLADFINEEVRKGSKTIGLAMMSFGKDSTDNMWIGGLANSNYGPMLNLSYQTVYGSIPPAPVVLNPNGGSFITNVKVMLVNKPAKDSVFYTIGKGAVADPTRNSTIFPEAGLVFTDTTTLKVIASRDGVYGNVVSATYFIRPVASPVFNPSPAVKYQKKVQVTIATTPADAVIYYSKDGSDPSEPYTQAIQLTQTTTLKTKAFSADFKYVTPIVEATYQIVSTEDLPGTGPAGVGYKNLTRDNQPEVGLWLKPEAFAGNADGSEVKLWNDMSGNANNAVNTYSGTPEALVNTGEKTKPAPLYVANGLNGFPVLNFGLQSGEGNTKALTIPDADNLDGGPGISIFLVVKRNEMLADFAALIQKRDITGGDAAKQAWDLEMDAGSNPNKFQFVVARDLFLKNAQVINTDKYYIVNVNHQGALQTASFITDGNIESTNFYNKPIQATNATLILGGFQPMSLAEAILINSDMNMAQIKLVTNCLAVKYNLTLTAGNVINEFPFKNDLIGIGKDKNITNTADDTHLFSSGGGIELKAAAISDVGDYVFAGHDGKAITENATSKQWNRSYYLKNIGEVTNISLGFDYGKAGLTTIPDNTYKLLYRSAESSSWTDLALTPTYDAGRKVLTFALSSFQNGYYTVSKLMSTSVKSFSKVAEFSVYPNPAQNKLVVNFKSDYKGKLLYHIVDLQGRTLVSSSIEKGAEAISETVNIDQLATGTYMLEVIQGSDKEVKMFMKN